MRVLLSYIFLLLFVSSSLAKSSDSTAIVTFDKDEIQALNAHNLADLLKATPFVYTTRSGINTSFFSSGLDQNSIAILKDDLPVLMHQNLEVSLHSIGLYDIDRVEVHFQNQNQSIRNANGISIHLYTKKFSRKLAEVEGRINYTNRGDLHTYMSGMLSNHRHAGRISLGRNFESSTTAIGEDRENALSANEVIRADVNYQFKILPGLSMLFQSSNSWIDALDKSAVIEGTTRTRDQQTRIANNQAYLKIKAKLSSAHSIETTGSFTRYHSAIANIDKDLNTGQSEPVSIKQALDSVNYLFAYFRTKLSGKYENYSYAFGLEATSLDDRVNKNINALRTKYNDYVIFTSFSYLFEDLVKLDATINFLTNTSAGNYLLPNFNVVLGPNRAISFQTSASNSIAYANVDQIFYPKEMTGEGIENNLLLKPAKLLNLSNVLHINQQNLRLKTGLLYSRVSDLAYNDGQRWQNGAQRTSTSTFFNFIIKKRSTIVKPTFILHGMNNLADSANLIFFYPEFNISTSSSVSRTNSKINLLFRTLGGFSRLERQDEIIQSLNAPVTLLSCSISQPLLNDKLTLVAGVNNLLNQYALEQEQFVVLDINKVLQSTDYIYANRGRNIFLSLAFQLP